MVNSENSSTKYLIFTSLLVLLLLIPVKSILAQGSMFGSIANSDASTPDAGEISFFGFIDNINEEIKIESSVGAGYDAGKWYDFFPNYLTVSPGDPYDYYFYNLSNKEGFHLEGLIPDNSFDSSHILLGTVDWPPKPSGLVGYSNSAASIQITWDAIEGLTYHIYRRQSSSNGSFFRIDDPSGSLSNPGVSEGMFIDSINIETGFGYHYLIIAQYTPGSFSPHSDFVEVISQEPEEPEEPVVSCPGDIIVECLAATDPSATGFATATDNIDAELTITFSDEIIDGNCPQEQIINRTWTATDSDQNSSTCIQIITQRDNTAPVITCPADTFVYFGEATQPANTGTATAQDNCDDNPTVTYVDQLTDNIITRTWIASDGCGNSVQCNQKIELIKNSGPVWHVSVDGNNDNDGSLNYPFATIRKAIESASSGDTVLVTDGTYSGEGNNDLDPAGKNIVFISESGPEVTIIDCGGTKISPHRAFYFHSGEDSTTKIIGFTISNGFSSNEGGGIRCENSSPSLSNLIFLNNGTDMGGAGIACLDNSSAIITDCEFINNNATLFGGGIYCSSSSPVISKSVFTGNTTNRFGGAIFLQNSTAPISDCYFSANIAENLGGAICLKNSSPDISGTDFISNISHNFGGAIYCDGSGPNISESVFANNSAKNYGGGIALEYYSSPQLTNCTMAKNQAVNGGAIYSSLSPIIINNSIISFSLSGGAIYNRYNDSLPAISCSNIFGNSGGDWVGNIADQSDLNGNLSIDPLFCEAETDDYQLAGNSACLSGNNDCGLLIGALDIGCDIITDIEETDDNSLPETYSLSQNYPNPFNPATTISFSLPKKSLVTITVYNVLGREIKTLLNETADAGNYSVTWDGKAENGQEVSSGIYFYRLSADSYIKNRKMVLLK